MCCVITGTSTLNTACVPSAPKFLLRARRPNGAFGAAAMSNDGQSLQEMVRQRMLSGEPFTLIELSTHYRRQNPRLYDRVDGDRVIAQLIKILRHAGRITHHKDGQKIIWRAAGKPSAGR